MATFTSEALLGVVPHEGTIVGRADREDLGQCLRATRAFYPGEVVFRERPLVHLQNPLSAALAPACLACSALLGGSLREVLQFSLETGAISGQGPVSLCDFAALERSGLLDDPQLVGLLPVALPCPRACGAVFCSEACRDRQLTAGHHRMLCTELPESQRPAWKNFCAHARQHCETFLLAAHIIAQAACEVLYGGVAVESVLARYTSFISIPWPDAVWAGTSGRGEWIARRRAALEASHTLLADILRCCVPEDSIKALVTLEGYSRLVGMLDLVCLGQDRHSPLEEPLQRALERDGQPQEVHVDLRRLALLRALAQRAEHENQELASPEDSESDGMVEVNDQRVADEALAAKGCNVNLCDLSTRVETIPLLHGFEGFGLAATVAMLNHSCTPNVDADCSANGEVVVSALRDVAAGEEFLLSYIDSSEPFEKRQHELMTRYPFCCRCLRCEEEQLRK